MKTSCRIEIDFKDKKIAEKILKSIKVDDFDFAVSKIEGNVLIADIKSDKASSLLHTIDDYLSCISVAENVLDKDKKH